MPEPLPLGEPPGEAVQHGGAHGQAAAAAAAAHVVEDQRQPACRSAAVTVRSRSRSVHELSTSPAVRSTMGSPGGTLSVRVQPGHPGARSPPRPGRWCSRAADDGLGQRAVRPARVGEGERAGIPAGQDRAAVADLPPGLGRGQRGQPEVGHGVPADFVAVRGQLAQVGAGHVARRPDRARDDVERRGQPVAVQHLGRGHLVGVTVIERQAHHGARGMAAGCVASGLAAGGGGGRSAHSGDQPQQGQGHHGQADGQPAGQPSSPPTAWPPAWPPSMPQRVPLGGDAPRPPAADLRTRLGRTAGDRLPLSG